MSSHNQIILNTFKPRPYQIPIIDALENKGYRKIIAVLPRRCLSGNTHITMSNGSFKLLKDIKVGDRVLSYDGTSFVSDTVINKWSTGIKKTVTVHSRGNIPLKCSESHVFATVSSYGKKISWNPLKDIGINRRFLSYAGIEQGTNRDYDMAEFWGYILSDGYVVGYQQPKFTNTNREILHRVEHLAKKLFDVEVIWRQKGNGYDLGFSNGTKGGGATSNPIKELCREEGLDVQKSKQRLPKVVWKFDNKSIYAFLAALISCDGSICIQKGNTNLSTSMPSSVEMSINCGKSYNYAFDIYWLLRKIGITTQQPVYERASNWKIRISSSGSVKKLLSVPIVGKLKAQEKALNTIRSFTKKRTVTHGCYLIKAKRYESTEEELYDIETKHHHNFIANGLVVHNSGKDITAFNIMIRQAIKRIGVYYYVLPNAVQARRVMFDGITSDGQRIIDYIPKELVDRVNIQQMKIVLYNGSIIQFVGSENYDSLRGSNPVGIVLSEAAYQNPQVYPTVRPILAGNGGWVIFISTPNGHNSFYDIFQVAQNYPDEWFSSFLTVDDTEHISREEIEREVESGEISRDMAEQEYRCNFSLGAIGAYYAKYLTDMEANNQITHVDWEPNYPVHTAWDLGMRDFTSILFFQVIDRRVHIIDIYQNSDVGLEHYIQYVLSKPYVYGYHIPPHDIEVREYTGGGITRRKKAAQLGLKFLEPQSTSLMDGIESVRTTLPRTYIDAKRCKILVTALRNYRKEYDYETKTYKNKPRHDLHSHVCDSLRYLCTSLHRLTTSSDPDALEKRYRETMYGSHHTSPFKSGW